MDISTERYLKKLIADDDKTYSLLFKLSKALGGKIARDVVKTIVLPKYAKNSSQIKFCVTMILYNAWLCSKFQASYPDNNIVVKYHRDRNRYTKFAKRYGLQYLRLNTLKQALQIMESQGYIKQFIQVAGYGQRDLSYFTPTDKLIDIFAKNPKDIKIKDVSTEVILLKDNDNMLMDWGQDSKDVKSMRRSLKAYNEFLQSQDIRLSLSYNQISIIQHELDKEKDGQRRGEEEEREGEGGRGENTKSADCIHDLLNSVVLKCCLEDSTSDKCGVTLSINPLLKYVRIFRNDFKHHGRFYAKWQSIKKDVRPYITINGEKICCLDFDQMHANFAYYECGAEMDGKAYEIDGMSKGLGKLAFQILLNSRSKYAGIMALEDKDNNHNLEGWKASDILDKMEQKHVAIKSVWYKRRGLEYMYKDSKIAEYIINTMTSAGVPVLALHDGFIVPDSHKEQLRQAMRYAYLSETCRYPGIKEE